MNCPLPTRSQVEAFRIAVMILCETGHKVQPALDAPGLFRIDGGEERSPGEIVEVAMRAAQERLTAVA